jgi:hypothetical protein
MYELFKDILEQIQQYPGLVIKEFLIISAIIAVAVILFDPVYQVIKNAYENLGFSEETAEKLASFSMAIALAAGFLNESMESSWVYTGDSNPTLFLGILGAIIIYITQSIFEALSRDDSDPSLGQLEDLSEPENKSYVLDDLVLPMVVIGSLSFDDINTGLKVIDPEYLILVFKSWIPTLAELIQLGLV